MAGKIFLLQKVTDFAPGFFDHVAVEGGVVQLLREGDAYAPAGTYTSQVFPAEPFFGLMPSWNIETPPGTSAEMFARLHVGGRWSRWFGFGRWSPYLDSASRPPEEDDNARLEEAVLSVREGQPAAEAVQMRVQLFSDDGQSTPHVRLLGLSTNATQMAGEEHMVERELEVPEYACLNRDPAIAGRIASATTMAMLMNRWGRDLLPEEVARTCFDHGGGSYSNLAFLTAMAGVHGFACYVAFAGIGALRGEIWEGRAVAARVHYRAPALQEEDADEGNRAPVLEGALADSTGHLVVVRGFVRRDGREHVIINDPLALGNRDVRHEISLAQFAKIYTGLAVFLQKGVPGSGCDHPHRRTARLAIRDNTLHVTADGHEIVPALLRDEDYLPATLCYTLSDGIAYAAAAQKTFYYPAPNENGDICFDRAMAAGRKLTCYFISGRGRMWVAEKLLKSLYFAPTPPAEAAEAAQPAGEDSDDDA